MDEETWRRFTYAVENSPIDECFAGMCELCNEIRSSQYHWIRGRKTPFVNQVFPIYLHRVLKMKNPSYADIEYLKPFLELSIYIVTYEFIADNPIMDQLLAALVTSSLPRELQKTIWNELRNGYYIVIKDRMMALPIASVNQFCAFFAVVRCCYDKFETGITDTFKYLSRSLEETPQRLYNGTAVNYLGGVLFELAGVVEWDLLGYLGFFCDFLSISLTRGDLDKRVGVCRLIGTVREQNNTRVIEFLTEKLMGCFVELLEAEDLHSQLLHVMGPFIEFFVRQGDVQVPVLVAFWMRNRENPEVIQALKDSLMSMSDRDVLEFLRSILASQFVPSAVQFVKQMIEYVPRFTSNCIELLNDRLEDSGRILVSLCQVKEKNVREAMSDLIHNFMKEPIRSDVQLNIIIAYLNQGGSIDCEPETVLRFVESALEKFFYHSRKTFEVLFFCVMSGLPVNADDLELLFARVEQDPESFWLFAGSCLLYGKLGNESTLIELLRRCRELSDGILLTMEQLSLRVGGNKDFVQVLFRVFMSSSEWTPRLYAVLGNTCLSIGAFDAFFEQIQGYLKSNNTAVYRFLLKFLDLTEMRSNLAGFARHHHCRKLRKVLIQGIHSMKLEVHENASNDSLIYLISASEGVPGSEIQLDCAEDRAYYSLRFQTTRRQRLVLLSGRLDPMLFFRQLNGENAALCWQILKRLPSAPLENRIDLSGLQLQYVAESLAHSQKCISYDFVRDLILRNRNSEAKHIRYLWSIVAREDFSVEENRKELLDIVKDKIYEVPKYPEPLKAYLRLATTNDTDFDFVLFLFENMNERLVEPFVSLLLKLRQYREWMTWVLAHHDEFESKAQFIDPILKSLSGQYDLRVHQSIDCDRSLVFIAMSPYLGVNISDHIESLLSEAFQSENESIISTIFTACHGNAYAELVENSILVAMNNSMRVKGNFCGLSNPGCLCYMNAVLQQLASNGEFLKRLRSSHSLRSDARELANLLYEMKFGTDEVLETWQYYREYAAYNGDFDPSVQQDALEYLDSVMESLPENCSELFRGKMKQVFMKMDGQIVSQPVEMFNCLQLDMGFETIEQSLDRFFAKEVLKGENQYTDSSTGEKFDVYRQNVIIEFPDYLICQLKRFRYDVSASRRYKIDAEVRFGPTLDVASENYILTGLVVHSGSAEGGHYMSLVQDGGGWVKCDDASVSTSDFTISEVGFGGQRYGWSTYLLFYRRQNVEPIIEKSMNTVLNALKSRACFELIKDHPSGSLRFNYFMRVLCERKLYAMVHEMLPRVMHLGELYCAYFSAILHYVSESTDFSHVMLKLICSDCDVRTITVISNHIHQICRYGETVKWLGNVFKETLLPECLDLIFLVFQEVSAPMDLVSYLETLQYLVEYIQDYDWLISFEGKICSCQSNISAYEKLMSMLCR